MIFKSTGEWPDAGAQGRQGSRLFDEVGERVNVGAYFSFLTRSWSRGEGGQRTDDGGPKWKAGSVGCPQPTGRLSHAGEVGGTSRRGEQGGCPPTVAEGRLGTADATRPFVPTSYFRVPPSPDFPAADFCVSPAASCGVLRPDMSSESVATQSRHPGPPSPPSATAPRTPDPVTFCLVEDRPEAEIGIKLLVLTLRDHCSGTRTILFHSRPTDAFRRWLAPFPDIELVESGLPGGGTSDVKPHALLAVLARGFRHVVWLDTDMMLAGDPRPLFMALDPDVIGLAEEAKFAPHQGTERRTRAWGFEVGRSLPYTLNTCLTRVTPAHLPVLEEWKRLLADDRYTRHFAVPLTQRPPHAMFDLDVLNAMLGAREWSHVPWHVFGAGRDILHSGGAIAYSFTERLGGLFRPIPPVLHALAMKPWVLLDPAQKFTGMYWRYRQLMQEISPFVALAKQYRDQTDDPCAWLDSWTVPGLALRAAGVGHFALRGLPVAAVAGAFKVVRDRWRA